MSAAAPARVPRFALLAEAAPAAVPSRAKAYASPYAAGVGIGLALLAAFCIAGRGLGASGAFSSAVAVGVSTLSPEHAAANPAFADYLPAGGGAGLRDWLVWEIAGVTLGGMLSAWFGGRFKWMTERGPRVTENRRLVHAFAGGAVMGIGAKLARGCTSGQALTGGALLSVGSWIFIAAAFAAAYAVAPLFRRQWT
ncbi:MAG TPA: YeeE/YedE thiosulfate transporter family protein [Longimicrobiaceae bacterium]|jgi:uncharacterized membrane protein YedE/YeeE|nr:YeeE/YedE thiosulfate transporter family protein [Longimicrobiaceae bacterium]